MEAYIYDCEGKKWALPRLLGWDISHGFCSPCDSFELEFLFEPGMLEVLPKAVEMEALHGGKTVFRGRVDEFEATGDGSGAKLRLRGRGMQALLMDNEAESADYYYPDLDFILEKHARSQGITEIEKGEAGGKTVRFSVENGWSHWKALSTFAEFCCGLRPRFSPEGRLILEGEKGGGLYKVDEKTAVISQSYTEDRYGVISRAVVKRRYTNTQSVSENGEFLALGGKCSRIVHVPKSSFYDAMRHEGEYQIRKSMEGYRVAKIRLAECFPAFPGDRLEMAASPLGLKGSFIITATRCVGSGEGVYTDIEMRREEETVNVAE